jgi:transcriptional regulator with PAS, ATPase and Fis domain
MLNFSIGSLIGRAVNCLPRLERLACVSTSQVALAADHGISIGDGVTAVIEPLRNSGASIGNLVWLESPSRAPAKLTMNWSSHRSFDELVGRHTTLEMARNSARRVAETNLPVLLQGETGTGKELFARAIHLASPRRNGPFVAVNCAAIPEELIASELFGYEKGAFTGAVNTGKRGKFVQANGGTIFLDEVTETSGAFQTALLRALEDRTIVPVGAERGISIDVRVIAATNRNLHHALHEGSLRQDLYYRLRGIPITLPPLRERVTDIPLLAEHFLARLGDGISLSQEAERLLLQHRWPGNVRELRSVLTSAVALSNGPVIQANDLLLDSPDFCATSVRPLPRLHHANEADIETLRRAMEATSGNVKEAAKRMGIARSSLYRRLRKLDLERTWAWH